MNPWSSVTNSLTNESDGAAGVVLLKIRLLGTVADWAAFVEVIITCVVSAFRRATQEPLEILPLGLFFRRSEFHRDGENLMEGFDHQTEHDRSIRNFSGRLI